MSNQTINSAYPISLQEIKAKLAKKRKRNQNNYKQLELIPDETNLRVKTITEVYKVLKPEKYYIVVVGNNTIRGVTFENWKYIMSLAEQIGFIVETYFGSEIIKHFIKVPRDERINTDWIVVLKK
ncbi:hypothetical protein [Crocosphaera sp.]|uniref:hypothetical protein n=1 Tax=Crocosphaera sp. TaxID=2729996 RepID=UPI003F226C05|nr:hypothetical protein [Crocosphaera sp.]